MAASRISLPRNERFASVHASHRPMINAIAVEITATRRLSHSGNQSMDMPTFHGSAGFGEATYFYNQASAQSDYFRSRQRDHSVRFQTRLRAAGTALQIFHRRDPSAPASQRPGAAFRD